MSTTPVAAAAVAVVAGPLVMKHELQPEWGPGIVVEDAPKYWVLFFEKAGLKKFIKEKAKVLVPVTLAADVVAALKSKSLGRSRPRPEGSASAKKKKAAGPKARFLTFKDQLVAFEKLFEGGFQGEKFIADERGRAGSTGKDALKEGAMAAAQAELSAEAFASATPEALFESARKLLKATNIVFPIEGSIPFAAMAPELRPAAVESLKALLHGEGDYGDRLEKFAGAIVLKDSKGVAKTVTWPFATVFGAMVAPAVHTCVKPTAFSTQALTLGIQAEKSQPVTAQGYRQFFSVSAKTNELLKAAGQQPRDLMDVYSFIHRTHAEKAEVPPQAP